MKDDDGEKLRALFEEAANAYRPTDAELARLDVRVLTRTKEIGGLPPSPVRARLGRYGAVGLGVAALVTLGIWQFSPGGASNVIAEPGAGLGPRLENVPNVTDVTNASASESEPNDEAKQVPTLAVSALPAVKGPVTANHHPTPVATSLPRVRAARSADVAPRGESPVASRSSLEEEVRLVRGASDRRRAGDLAGALVLLDEHARRYPLGVLANERDVERIVALCDMGSKAQAQTLGQAFLSARPDSPLAERIRASCADGAGGGN